MLAFVAMLALLAITFYTQVKTLGSGNPYQWYLLLMIVVIGGVSYLFSKKMKEEKWFKKQQKKKKELTKRKTRNKF